MKKHFILPISLMAVLFVSCTPAKSKKKSTSIVKSSTQEQVSATSAKSETTSYVSATQSSASIAPTSTSSGTIIPVSSSSATSEAPILDEYTKYFKLEGNDFATELGYASGGVKFDDTETPSKVAELQTYFENNVIYENLVGPLSCTNINSPKTDVVHLTLGSGSNFNGTFKYKSIVKMFKVIVHATMYYKYDSYHEITNYDSEAKITFNDEITPLEYNATEQKGVEKEFILESETGITEFSIQSSDGRVFLDSLEITWRG